MPNIVVKERTLSMKKSNFWRKIRIAYDYFTRNHNPWNSQRKSSNQTLQSSICIVTKFWLVIKELHDKLQIRNQILQCRYIAKYWNAIFLISRDERTESINKSIPESFTHSLFNFGQGNQQSKKIKHQFCKLSQLNDDIPLLIYKLSFFIIENITIFSFIFRDPRASLKMGKL